MLLRIGRVIAGVLVIAALVTQFVLSLRGSGFSVVNFFSYFTVLSNLFAVVVLFASALGRTPAPLIRGAAVFCMAVTGIVYALLLADIDVAISEPWINSVIHQIMPIAMVADWLVDPPRERLRIRRTLLWLVIPVIYLAYSLVRGAVVGWYPYPFIDPTRPGGYGRVALDSIGLAAGILVIAVTLTWLGNLRGRPVTES